MIIGRNSLISALVFLLALVPILPQAATAHDPGQDPPLRQEELNQLLAPIALYPDDLLAQVLIASTYPLEVVQADRWIRQYNNLSNTALTAALDAKPWDPGIKSLVNFPQVLQMMSEKLDWTQKLGDAFLAQQKGVMDTIQRLRRKAMAEGHLKSTVEQRVSLENEDQIIIIAAANPRVVYVPVYNPTVVYGTWRYPAYPPYYHYPRYRHHRRYTTGAAGFSFGVGVTKGAAWGYAWGGCHWARSKVDIDIHRNTKFNRKIVRSKYANKALVRHGGRGTWKHNPRHRKGAAHRNWSTAAQFNKGSSRNVPSNKAVRGRTDTGRSSFSRGSSSRVGRHAIHGRQNIRRSSANGSYSRSGTQPSRYSGQRSHTRTFRGYEQGRRTKGYSHRGRSGASSYKGSRGGMRRGSAGGGFSSRGRR